MASKQATRRLQKEYAAMQASSPPYVYSRPDEANILEWHYILRGPPNTPYASGEYYGLLTFPPEYPFRPPSIKMFTPSGRFSPDKKICTSMSDYHPGTWNPAWSVATILTGLLSFMCSDEMTTGSIKTSEGDKKILASRSHAWNLMNQKFISIFPDYATLELTDLPNMGEPVSTSEPTPLNLLPLSSISNVATAIPQRQIQQLPLKRREKEREANLERFREGGSGYAVWAVVIVVASLFAVRILV